MPKTNKETPSGTIRIKAKDLKSYKKTKTGWRNAKFDAKGILEVIKLFKAEKNFDLLIDKKDPRFLKGQLSPNGSQQGTRINSLPNGERLEKAFSLFSPNLLLHDQKSHDHWDVMYQNKGGTFSYVYTINKRKKHMARKYRKVNEFEKRHKKLMMNVTKSLKDKEDIMAVPMFTLLKTYMRVGNETYYKANGHRGLTTLTKKNVNVKGNNVTFSFHGKDGVPLKISQVFSDKYTRRLQGVLKAKKKNEFVFEKNGALLHEHDFKAAFMKYCGHEFYPHIVRSHYATMQVKKFLEKQKKITKDNANSLFMKIAHELGHKKFNKKTGEWEEHFAVTVNSYIQPELVEKMKKKIG